ncbi:PepSY-associated TM helix domain-containing protein [Paraburkholderia sp.]|uniref:PepSY-associated TM helix domain-containing protein n=1 Tax=Paraburkholderia sp. TaxID=1926495 RepID=UPI002386D8A0|nr:PepSY-associated TM helix domain-containing protein [Paraburkholderia sp.]MDE1179639.1 PepSY-associated TM helix domain-containing protein [Paraburkholderia sp.]
MRPVLVQLHRWFGVGTALFLFLAGLTGAIIAWDHELDALLNPSFYNARTQGTPLSPVELSHRIEAADPRIEVTYLPLSIEPGQTLQAMVMPRTNPSTGQPYTVDFSQIAVDPSTGEVQGRREWGAFSVTRLNLIPFIYKLHYTLQLPFTGGIDWGTWLMGCVGIVWLFDSVIALVLSFPSPKAWRKSFAFRVKRGGYALTFDLHRSGGVWIWGLLGIMALTSISMNLSDPVVRPVVSTVSTLSPNLVDIPALLRAPGAGEKPVSRERIVEIAAQTGKDKQLGVPPGALYWVPGLHAYAIGFFAAGNEHGGAGLGNPWLYFDALNGKLVGSSIPGTGSAGDIFMQAQFPLHSGRIIGLGGRILVSVLGVLVAVLSATGLMIWLKKLNARRKAAEGAKARAAGAAARF